MPFTPLHMGPAIALKAVAQRRFSLMVFGWSQICMDLQPGYAMLTGTGELHGLSHTLAGALLIGLVAALSGKPLGEFGLRMLKLPKELPITWGVAFLSAYIGTLSHIAIDSIMHADVTPWWPLTKVSPFYGVISIDALHVVCLATAGVGALLFWLVRYVSARRMRERLGDLQDLQLAEQRLLDIRAGRTRSVPLEEVARRHDPKD